MSHTTQTHTPGSFTRDEAKSLARLLKHPQISKLIEEIKKQEEDEENNP